VGRNRRAARVRCGAGERAQMQESGRGRVAGEAERGVRKKGEGKGALPGGVARLERGRGKRGAEELGRAS
jgi:hypothetical protein